MKTLTQTQKKILKHNIKIEAEIERFCREEERRERTVKLTVIK